MISRNEYYLEIVTIVIFYKIFYKKQCNLLRKNLFTHQKIKEIPRWYDLTDNETPCTRQTSKHR